MPYSMHAVPQECTVQAKVQGISSPTHLHRSADKLPNSATGCWGRVTVPSQICGCAWAIHDPCRHAHTSAEVWLVW